VGSFDPHESVSLDKGLCGDAASSKKTVVVNNSANDPRYKASSGLVKSEIVVPIFIRGALYGVIDINSYFADTFNFDEQKFVEGCAALVSGYLEKPH
jgi:L-methionine (R)-S-oxide reductase